MDALPILEQEFLPLRAKLLEIAAAMDRLDRADAWPADDPRVAKIRAAIEALGRPGADRAERIQLVFSRPYDEGWKEGMKMTNVE